MEKQEIELLKKERAADKKLLNAVLKENSRLSEELNPTINNIIL